MTTEAATARLINPDSSPPDTQALSAFLASNPDFLPILCATELKGVLEALLAQEPAVLADLVLPSPPDGVASLPHTQQRLWREKLARLTYKINDLSTTAENNARLDRVLHNFACALLRAADRDPNQVIALIHQHFTVDSAQLIVYDELDSQTKQLLEGWLTSSTPLCGRLNETQRQAVFGNEFPDTGSAALIAMGQKPTQPHWILALGRFTPDGFNPSQGTLFLSQIGELVHSFLCE